MITEFNREDHARNLPDAYRKDESSNNRRILEIEKNATDKLREAVSAIFDSLDIDKATGSTLDLYGDMYGQARGSFTDEQYRLKIRQRIAMAFASTDYNSIVNALAGMIGAPTEEICLEDAAEGGNVDVTQFPYDTLQEAGFTVPQVREMIESLLPAGVRITGMNIGHDVPDIKLQPASTLTHAEHYTVEVVCRFYETAETEEITASAAITHAEKYTMEV